MVNGHSEEEDRIGTTEDVGLAEQDDKPKKPKKEELLKSYIEDLEEEKEDNDMEKKELGEGVSIKNTQRKETQV